MKPHLRFRHAGGFSLIELVFSVSIFGMIASAFVMTTRASGRTADTQGAVFDLESELSEVQDTLRRELRRSGYAVHAGTAYPQISDAGETSDFKHTGAPDAAVAREIVYVAPADANNDDWPDLDSQNRVVWEADVRAVLIRPIADGFHELILARTDGTERVLSRRALALDFATSADTGFAIPLRAATYTVTLGRRSRGLLIERTAAGSVALLNGGFSE